MGDIRYFTRANRHRPAAEWVESLDARLSVQLRAKIKKLGQYGLDLLETDMLKKIGGEDKDLYELRSGQARIAAYLDRNAACFVLLSGWLKKRQQARQDVEQARRLLREYIGGNRGRDDG